ncbi:DUF748 domain-containing protein [Bdellovibrio sp. HCB337]|uniref:DUF748 domain-containing protein n=1 Tax=Bdellovibrio sp. HCB337 TaxID=3394358 RepID=UPI0039A465EA
MERILSSLKRTHKIVIALIVLLIVVRIFLPIGIKHAINWYLGNKIVSYQGAIADFDLHLYRGAYEILGLKLWKRNSDRETPLVDAKRIDLSLAWRALWRRKLLGDLKIDRLRLTFIDSESNNKKQFGTDEKNWNAILKKLLPIEIESLKITNSEVHFLNRDYKVPVDIYVDRIQVDAANLRNTDQKDVLLPSTATIKGRLQADAPFSLKAQFNILKDPLAFNIDAQMKDFNLKKMNNFFLVYGPFTFATGTFSLFSEVATNKGLVVGYAKPFFENVKMIANNESFISTKHAIAEFLLGFGNLILRNPSKDTATRIEFQGALTSPEINKWEAFWLSLRNAFGSPLQKKIEDDVDIKSLPKR